MPNNIVFYIIQICIYFR